MFHNKTTVIIISLLITGIAIFLSVPRFIENEKLEVLLERLNDYPYLEEKIPITKIKSDNNQNPNIDSNNVFEEMKKQI